MNTARVLSEPMLSQMCVLIYTDFNHDGDRIETAIGIFDSFESAEEYANERKFRMFEVVRFELLLTSN